MSRRQDLHRIRNVFAGVSIMKLDVTEWAELNFGDCDLGDVRRTRRAVKVAEQMANFPDGSTPDQFECWSDLKAAYRLFDCEEVTFSAIMQPHWQQTRVKSNGRVLVIGDTMSTNYGQRRQISGLGPIGDGNGRGFLLHSSLIVDAGSAEIIGLAGQEVLYRESVAKENSYQKTQRPRESEVWGRVIDLVGPPDESTQYVHVFDRGADNLDVFCHLVEQRSDWVIRAAQLHRTVYDNQGTKTNLHQLLDASQALGTYELQVRAKSGKPSRTASLEVRVARATIKRPKRVTPYQKQVEFQELTQSVVEVREINAPVGVEPLRWVLWTSLPVTNFDLAWTIIEYYEHRWLIEEFHKALKTGCRLESRQYATAQRLEAVCAMMSVLAVRLVQMKTIARAHPELPAERVVPQQWLKMLQALRRRSQIHTVREFYRHLAGLGGFLMRKSDGDPGWITIWKGTEKLLLALRGYEAMQSKCG